MANKTLSVKELALDEGYKKLSPEAKTIVFSKVIKDDKEYSNLSDDAKTIVAKKLGVDGTVEPQPSPSNLKPKERIRLGVMNLLGGKDLERDLQLEQEINYNAYPNRLKADRERNFVKKMLGSLISGGIAGNIARSIPALQGTSKVGQITGNIYRSAPTLGQRSVVSAIEGAVGVQPFLDNESIKNRILLTGGAAVATPVIGETIGFGIKAGSGLYRGIKKIATKLTTKDPRIPVMNQIQNEIQTVKRTESGVTSSKNLQMRSAEEVGNEAEKAIVKETQDSINAATSEVRTQKIKLRQDSFQAARKMNKEVDSLDGELTLESDVAAKTFQSKVTGFFRRNSNAYGRELDSVSDQISETGRLTRGEALDVLERTLKRSSSEADISGGGIYEKIMGLAKYKYTPEVFDEASKTIVNRDMKELIPFKEFRNELRNIWKSVYKGSDRMQVDEIPAAILQSEFGELVSNIPGGELFKSLQNAYRPVISYMNKANSILQPYKGEAYTKGAEMLVKRVATPGGAAKADQDLIEFLQSGTQRFGKGLGNITAKARQIGENIKVVKTKMREASMYTQNQLMQIGEDGAIKLSKIKDAGETSIKEAQKQATMTVAKIQQEAARQEMILSQRISLLTSRGEKVEKILAQRALVKKVAIGVSAVITGLSGLYGLHRAVSGSRSLEEITN